MSKVKSTLASLIIKEHFGELAEKVSAYLLQNGHKSLKDIIKSLPVDKEDVKKLLCILIYNHLVTFRKNKQNITEYHLALDNVLNRKRCQKYVYYAKVKFGDIAELVVETLLLNGCDILSRVSKCVADRLEVDEADERKPDVELVIQKCKELILGHFLTRVKNPMLAEETDLIIEEQESFTVPQGIGKKLKANDQLNQPAAKKAKIQNSTEDKEEYEDEGVYWHINFNRFDQAFIDQMIVDATSERLDQSASKIISVVLKMTETERTLISPATRSVSIFDIMKQLPSIPRLEQGEVAQYLSLLSDEKTGGFVTKTDEASGGMYCVNIEYSIELICQSACSTIIQERFGSKACRVFRLLLEKKHLEQKQIGELAMIPFKEVKELLYKLFDERFLKIQEVSKASDYAPSRTFYLFGVDLPQVARLLVNRCYQAIGNLMMRRESEMEDNKRLLEKNEKIEGILSALSAANEDTEQVLEELEELITPTEKQQLEKLKIDLARLEQGEIQVEQSVFILKCYLTYH